MKVSHSTKKSTGHGTGVLVAQVLGRRRRMLGVLARIPEKTRVFATTRRNIRRFPNLFRRNAGARVEMPR